MFDQVCDNKWTAAVVQDAKRNGGRDDEVLKCKSQALAEQASGDVYFFIPKGVTAKSDSAVSKACFLSCIFPGAVKDILTPC